MTEVWKLDSEWYCLYTENKDVMRRVRRSYHDFKITADYYKNEKLKAIQYKIPIKRKRSAYHLANIDKSV